MKYRLIKEESGYTLIELLAVIVILIIVGFIVVGILFSTLRGKNKTAVLNETTRNGNQIMFQMSKTIEFAKNFEGIKEASGVEFDDNCVAYDSPSPTPTPIYKSVKVKMFDNQDVIFSCDDPNFTISSNSASLVDTVNFRITSCSFTCHQAYLTLPPTIGINFTLATKNDSGFAEKKASIDFKTTVTMRNKKD